MIPIKSDHYPVTFKVTLLSTDHRVAHNPIHILDYSKGDYDGMIDFLYRIDLTTYYKLGISLTIHKKCFVGCNQETYFYILIEK